MIKDLCHFFLFCDKNIQNDWNKRGYNWILIFSALLELLRCSKLISI